MVTAVVDRPAQKSRSGVGVLLVVTAVCAAVLGQVEPLYGFLPFALLALLWLVRWTGALAYAPTRGVPVLYFAIIFVTCLAPAAGTFGTLARIALGGIALLVWLHIMRAGGRSFPAATGWAVAVFLGALAVAAFAAPSLNFGIARFLNAALFVPLIFLVYRRPHGPSVAFATVATGAFQMVGVALQYLGFLGGTWGGLLLSGTTYNPETSSWLRRYTGFLQNPNNLALMLALGVIVLAVTITARHPLRLKAFMLGLIGVFGYGIVLTGSRGGLVAVGLGLLVILLARGARGWFAAAALIIGAYFFAKILQWQALDRVVESFGQILAGTDTSAQQRSAAWADRIATSDGVTLLTGQGFGGYAAELFARQIGLDIDAEAARAATVDNSWLKLQLEAGLAATVPFALLAIVAVLGAFYASKAGDRALGISASAALIAMLWRSTTVDMFDQNPWNALFFIAIGLALSSIGVQRTSTGTSSAQERDTGSTRQPTRTIASRKWARPSLRIAASTVGENR